MDVYPAAASRTHPPDDVFDDPWFPRHNWAAAWAHDLVCHLVIRAGLPAPWWVHWRTPPKDRPPLTVSWRFRDTPHELFLETGRNLEMPAFQLAWGDADDPHVSRWFSPTPEGFHEALLFVRVLPLPRTPDGTLLRAD